VDLFAQSTIQQCWQLSESILFNQSANNPAADGAESLKKSFFVVV